jgi:hypothetical protein
MELKTPRKKKKGKIGPTNTMVKFLKGGTKKNSNPTQNHKNQKKKNK